VKGATTANNTIIDIWDCNGGANQQWVVDPVNYALKSGMGTGCIDGGADVILYSCNQGLNQQFYFGAMQTCTWQSGFTCQDWANSASPPSWYRIDRSSRTACGASCTYGCPPGTYGSCPSGSAGDPHS
jgi:hypothetical protein